jgi:hypothetical protein
MVVAETRATRLVPVAFDGSSQSVDVLDMAGVSPTEPFFHQTVQRVLADRSLAPVTVGAEWLVTEAARRGRLPSAVIFHVGRCGSTLLANVVQATLATTVLKEPSAVSDLCAGWLLARDGATRQQLGAQLGAAVRVLTGAWALGDRAPWLKTAAWNVQAAPLLLGLRPKLPGVFVHRDPFATVASMLDQPPSWAPILGAPRAVQSAFFPSLRDLPYGARVESVELFAHSWRSAVEAAIAARHQLEFVDYADLASDPRAVLFRLANRWGWEPAVLDPDAGAAVLATYAKDPDGRAVFDATGAHRRGPLSAEDSRRVAVIVAEVAERFTDAQRPLAAGSAEFQEALE